MADPRFNAIRQLVKDNSPPWLRNKWGERFLYSIAIQFDALADALRDGIKMHFPGQNVSALPYLGADRVIERGFAESDENYAARLSRAFDDWAIAGSRSSNNCSGTSRHPSRESATSSTDTTVSPTTTSRHGSRSRRAQ